ncbi:MAG: DUF4124 domain-containing protein [Xanthomonadales bacterium]|nr:DUF4124 domain-containing protein [Xanthomonadales bacterium]
MMNKSRHLICGLALTLGAAGPAAIASEAIYRWVDADGVVHYADRPPEGVQTEMVATGETRGLGLASARTSSPAATPGADEAEEQSYAQQRRDERAERRKESTERRRELAAECEAMRQQRDFVEPNPRVIVPGPDGEPRRLTDGERERMLNEAKTFLARNCE